MKHKHMRLLKRPFRAHELEWRVLVSGLKKGGGAWVQVIAYVQRDMIMNRLDEVTLGAWKKEFEDTPATMGNFNSVMCKVTATIEGQDYIGYDGAEMTQVEPVKGGLTMAFKRACIDLGIGRYLNQMPATFAMVKESLVKTDNKADWSRVKIKDNYFYWKTPEVPQEFRQVNYIKKGVIEDIEKLAETKNASVESICAEYGVEQLSDLYIDEGDKIIILLNKKATPEKKGKK